MTWKKSDRLLKPSAQCLRCKKEEPGLFESCHGKKKHYTGCTRQEWHARRRKYKILRERPTF